MKLARKPNFFAGEGWGEGAVQCPTKDVGNDKAAGRRASTEQMSTTPRELPQISY